MSKQPSGWTLETLRIHLLAVMDERKEAAREAVRVALEAIDAERTHTLTTAAVVAALISAIVAVLGFMLYGVLHR